MRVVYERRKSGLVTWRVVGENGTTVIANGFIAGGVANNMRIAKKKAAHALRMVSK